MSVNKVPNSPPEEAPEPNEAFQVEGKNTELLAVRVSPELMAALHKLADGSKRPVPEIVRSYLLFHLLPDMVKVAVQKLQSGNDSGLETYSGASFRLQIGKRQLEHVEAVCADSMRRLEAIQGMSKKAGVRFEEAERMAAAAYGDYIKELMAAHDAFEENPEAFAPDSFVAKVNAEAARIEEEENA